MAYDKIVDSAALDEALTDIADAIRGKTGGTDKLTMEGMAAAIAGISTGGSVSGITVDTVVVTESLSHGDEVYAYFSSLLEPSTDAEPLLIKAFIIENVAVAKLTDNAVLGFVAYHLNSKSPTALNSLLRWRNGGYSTASNGSAFDAVLNAGTEFYLITVNAREVWDATL